MTRQQLIDALAPLVLADRRTEAAERPRSTPYYFLNINHPVLRRYYLDYLAKIGEVAPPGDETRTRFELAMLHPAALNSLAEHYKSQGRFTL